MSHKKQKNGPKMTRNKAEKELRKAQQAERLRKVEKGEIVVEETIIKKSNKKPSKKGKVQQRRQHVCKTLMFQLQSGLNHRNEPLTDTDKIRIKKEIAILQDRLKL